jgi:hypothetical protein
LWVTTFVHFTMCLAKLLGEGVGESSRIEAYVFWTPQMTNL